MTAEILIKAENLSLHVPVFMPSDRKLTINPVRLISGLYGHQSDRKVKTLLSGVNFTLYKGQRLGLIGQNGAGKTTLLRVLSGVYKPSGGELQVNGVSQALFNVQLGMKAEATGIENIYLRGLQMGMKLSEISDVVEDVAEFSGIGENINGLFGDYSTGMKLRLSIAISTMMNPDILIMDEWIGSGDDEFRKKIKERMDALIKKSRGLVIATHSENLMKDLCTHGLVMSQGECLFYGAVGNALNFYKTLQSSSKQS